MTQKNAFLLCLLVVGLCFANSLPNDLVLDDIPLVGANPAIREIAPIKFLSSSYWPSEQNAGIYRPLTIFSLAVDYALWHRWAGGYRLTNLLLHALNGWLLFLLVSSLVENSAAPIAAALIYVAHPVHSEAVITIVGRSELLAAFFFLSAWLFYRRGKTGLAAAAFFLSLLCKENAIVLPAVLILYTYFREGRSFGKTLAAWKSLLAVTAAALPYLGLRIWVLGGLAIPSDFQYMGGKLSLLERWMTSGRVFLRYLRLIFFPVDVAGDYDFNSIPIAHPGNWDAWLGLLLVATIVAIAYWFRRRNGLVSFGLLFAIIALVPVSNWITPISILMAERFLYLPMAGLSIVGGIAVAGIRDVHIQKLLGVGWLAIAVLLCVAHDYVWRNDFTFYGNMARVEPDNAKGRLGYGFALVQAGSMSLAAEQLEAGLRILPEHPGLLSTLALTRMTPTSCADAYPLLDRALKTNPNHGDTHRRVADCLLLEGRIPEARIEYERALENIRFPDSLLLIRWGLTLENAGQKTSAIAAYERAVLIDPENLLLRAKITGLQ